MKKELRERINKAIITFDGMTKSGKTTLINELTDNLREAVYVHPFDCSSYGVDLRKRWQSATIPEIRSAHSIANEVVRAYAKSCNHLVVRDRTAFSLYEFLYHRGMWDGGSEVPLPYYTSDIVVESSFRTRVHFFVKRDREEITESLASMAKSNGMHVIDNSGTILSSIEQICEVLDANIS